MSSDPKFDVTGNGGYTNSYAPTVSGTDTPASGTGAGPQVQLVVNGHLQPAPASQGGFGTWSAAAGLHDGANSVQAVETVGGVQQASRTVTYDVVTRAPDVAFTRYVSAVDAPQQTVTGTVTSPGAPGVVAGRVLTIADDGTPVAQATVQADGTWSAPLTLKHLGLNHLTATMTDAAGNAGAGEADWTYTTTPSPVAITTAGGVVSQPQQLVGGTASPGDAIRLLDDGAAIDAFTVNASGTWLRGETLSGPGANAIQAVDTSAAGNVGTSNTVLYTLAPVVAPVVAPIAVPSVAPTAAPSVAPIPAPSVTVASAASGLTAQPGFAVSGRATAGSIVALFDAGAPVSHVVAGPDGSWTLAATLLEGLNPLTVTDSTPAGTVNAAPIGVILDTTPPSVAFGAAPRLAGTVATVATLSGTASDANGVRGVELYDGATDLGAAQVGADGGWTFTRDFGQGSFDHLAAVATDMAGNRATAAAPYTFDTVPAGPRSVGAVRTYDASGVLASVLTQSADGGVGAATVANGDGTATSTGFEDGQALYSIGGDVMTGNGTAETFVFQPAMGHARVTDFVVAGPGHDVLALSRADFDDVAQVLQNTTMNHGSAVIHVSPDDTIRLAGVTKAQLAHHAADLAFTG